MRFFHQGKILGEFDGPGSVRALLSGGEDLQTNQLHGLLVAVKVWLMIIHLEWKLSHLKKNSR